jgi:DNA segregation ATPase FtsK/SpoIIIE, S-DNA-T family
MLLLVDDWDQLARSATEGRDAVAELLAALLREGASVGLLVVAAGDRSLVTGVGASLFSRRLLLRPADPTDWLLAGLSTRQVPTQLPPGRGLLGDGIEVQLALPTERPPRLVPLKGGRLPLRVDALPRRVRTSDHPALDGAPGRLAVGLGGDACEPQYLDEQCDGRRWLVAGAPGSGVSTFLLALACRLLAQGRPIAVVAGNARSPLTALRSDPRAAGWFMDDATQLAPVWAEHADLAVVVDNAQHVVDTAWDVALREFSHGVEAAGGLLVCGASASALSTQYRGVAVEVGRSQTGVLFGPSSVTDSALFGQRLRADPAAPPGRGYLISRGRATPIQAFAPDDEGSYPAAISSPSAGSERSRPQ